MPWLSHSMQKSNSSGLTLEELLIRSSSYSVLQNYMHIPTKFLLSPYPACCLQSAFIHIDFRNSSFLLLPAKRRIVTKKAGIGFNSRYPPFCELIMFFIRNCSTDRTAERFRQRQRRIRSCRIFPGHQRHDNRRSLHEQ